MDFLQAFPIAIIDEDYEGKAAAGRGMRQLAAAICVKFAGLLQRFAAFLCKGCARTLDKSLN
jgi:hypothetical protein